MRGEEFLNASLGFPLVRNQLNEKPLGTCSTETETPWNFFNRNRNPFEDHESSMARSTDQIEILIPS